MTLRGCGGKRLFTVLFIGITAWYSVAAEDAIFERINRSNGLSNSSVSSIVQDKWGFLWFGTQSGLQRYDGYSFTVYEHEAFNDESLSHNLIQTMYMDSDEETIWIGTYGGINRFDITHSSFSVMKNEPDDTASLSNDTVVAISKDRQGELWIGTLDGLNRQKDGQTDFTRYYHDPGNPVSLANNTVRALIEDRNGVLWIGTLGGLQSYDRQHDTFIRHEIAEPGKSMKTEYVMTLIQAEDGAIWAGTWNNGISRIDPVSGEVRNFRMPETPVYTLRFDSGGTLLVGTWGKGLIEFDSEAWEIIRQSRFSSSPASISHDIVYSLYQDDSGILWVGTNGGGINKLDRKRSFFPFYSNDPENPSSIGKGKINDVFEDSRGTLWAGIYNAGLDRYDPATGEWKHYVHDPADQSSITHNNVTDIFEDSRGRFWVATQDGLDLMDRDKGTFNRYLPDPSNPNSLGDEIIYALAEDRDGRLWVGTYHAGITVVDTDTGECRSYRYEEADPRSLSANMIYKIFFDSRDTIWIGTGDGLNRYDSESDSFTRISYDPGNPNGLGSNTIRDIYESVDGMLWFGTTSGGITSYDSDSKSFRHYGKSDGLPDNSVIAILEDREGVLWAATPWGLAVYSKDEDQFRLMDDDNGIRGKEFTVGHCRTAEGRLYFGSIEGLQEVETAKTAWNTFVPPVVLTSLAIFDQEQKLEVPVFATDNLSLSYKDNYITFGFASLDFTTPEKNRYAYKLEGLDAEWRYPGTRNYASYTDLPGGEYVFRVRGTNSDGTWSSHEAQTVLIVSTPPWKSWWAYSLYGLILLGMVFLIFEIRAGRLRKRQVEELNRIRNELEEANRRLEQLSSIDEGTGIPNRRHLYEVLEREWKHCIRENRQLSVIMLDLDHFKNYNDNYGHPAGDACLKTVAETLRRSIGRPRDTVARFGGEEFIILLPDTTEEGAAYVAERIRYEIDRLRIPHNFSETADHLTVSLGVAATVPSQLMSPESCIEEADKALYQAKREGRNRVVVINYQPQK